jgi:ABC-type branched-subunit amino acid transport system ATPase component
VRRGDDGAASFIGLADFADMLAGELSGGQRRLLALGRAMAMKPSC